MKKVLFVVAMAITLLQSGYAQEKILPPFVYPDEQELRDAISEWQDQKFGMFIHWGTYSQWGIVESWSICPVDKPFTSIRPHNMSYFEYLQKYEALKTTFNPVKFDPDKWAAAAQRAGMKYVVFTTKHHDGFNMFDTGYSDYKISDKDCPYSSNPKSNIAKEVFDAFRRHGLKAGAYYSIADWHCQDYWWDYFPPMGSGINYSATKYPEKWQGLNDFINNQLDELTSGEYGDLQMLWFDLCSPSPEARIQWDRLAKTIRDNQPDALMVVRYSNGKYENYRTCEQRIPEEKLDYPWESCITMAGSWSYKPGDKYRSVWNILSKLVMVVSRGGNLLLNVGPDSNGELAPDAYDRMEKVGDWMAVNSIGIYGTRACDVAQEDNIFFTSRDGNVFAFYVSEENKNELPATVILKSVTPSSSKGVTLLGYGKPLKWEKTAEGTVIHVPETVRKNPPCDYVWCFNIR